MMDAPTLSNRRIREATNMMVDRDYIAQEIYGGLAIPSTRC